jgi:AcrR family transcriptional regulator
MSPRQGLDTATIIETAASMADELGMTEITLASLAKRLNIKTPSLYNHIEGLEGLKKLVALYGLKELRKVLAEQLNDQDKEQTVINMARAYINFARIRPGIYELTLQAPKHNDKESHEVGGEIVAMLLSVFKNYGLEDEAALHTVRCFRSALHGFASLEQNKAFGLLIDRDLTLKILVHSILSGIPSTKRYFAN